MTGNEHLEPRVAKLETSVDNLTKSLSSFENEVRNALNTIIQGQKTPWATVISFVGLVIIIGGLAFAPVIDRVNTLEIYERQTEQGLNNEQVKNAQHDKRLEALEREVFK